MSINIFILFDDIAAAYQHPAESFESDETDAILKGILNNPAVTQDFKVIVIVKHKENHSMNCEKHIPKEEKSVIPRGKE